MSDVTPVAHDSAKKSRHSWPVRWSLRLLIAVVTVACVLLSWGAYYYHMGQTHEDVAQELSRFGCTIGWELTHTEVETLPANPTGKLASPNPQFGRRSRKLKGTGNWLSDYGVEPVFQRIKSIAHRRPISEEDLQHMVDQIKRLDRVSTLELNGNASDARLTQSQLATILSHVSVDVLIVSRSQLDGSRIAELGYSRLHSVDLSHTYFTDAAIDDLPDSLVELYLVRTAVTDEGLDKLARLKLLTYLDLRRTPTSRDAMERLQTKLPNCKILWEPLGSP